MAKNGKDRALDADFAKKLSLVSEAVNEDLGWPVAIPGLEMNSSDCLTRVPCNSYMLTKLLSGGVPLGRMIEFWGDPDVGKCLGKGTPVLMFDGTIKLVEHVKTGDLLMGDDSKPRKVLSVTSGKEELFQVKQHNGDDYVVNKSHILSLVKSPIKGRNNRDIVDMDLEEFIKLPRYHRYKGYKVPVDWKSRRIPVDPYFVGLWIGDGVTRTAGGVGFSIGHKDKKLVGYLKKFCEGNGFVLNEYRDKRSAVSTYVVCLRKGSVGSGRDHHWLNRAFKKLGIVVSYVSDNGSKRWKSNKRIPRQYLMNSRIVRLQLLAGFLDAGGYLNRNNNSFDFTTRNSLAPDIEFLCRSLGFRVTISDKKVKKHRYKRFTISGNVHSIPCILNRKKADIRKTTKNPLVGAIKVESIGVGKYYGFRISGNGRFLLGDFTVTHNTTCVEDMMIGFQRYPGISVLLDAESKWHRGRAMAMGHNPSRHLHLAADTIESGRKSIESTIEKMRDPASGFPPDMPVGFFWDTISSAQTESEKEGGGRMMDKALLCRELCRSLSKTLPRTQCSVVFISQTHVKPGKGGAPAQKVSSSGGDAVPFYSTKRIKVWTQGQGNASRFNYPDANSGILTFLKTNKDHLDPPWRTLEVPILYKTGIHPVYELLIFLCNDKDGKEAFISGGRCTVTDFPEKGKKISFYMKQVPDQMEKYPDLMLHLRNQVDVVWERKFG